MVVQRNNGVKTTIKTLEIYNVFKLNAPLIYVKYFVIACNSRLQIKSVQCNTCISQGLAFKERIRPGGGREFTTGTH